MKYTLNCEKCGEKIITDDIDSHAFCIGDIEVFYCNDCMDEQNCTNDTA